MRENLTSKRADVHRPATFDPADYRVIDYIDNKRPEPPMPPFPPGMNTAEVYERYEAYVKVWQERIFEHFPNWRTGGGDHTSIFQCNHCGHPGIRWVAVVEHIPTGNKLAFGETCAERCDLPGRDAFRVKFIKDRAAREAAAYQAAQEKAQFEADNPEVVSFLREQAEQLRGWEQWEGDGRNPYRRPHDFVCDMIRTYERHGKLSENQTAATAKFAAKAAEFAARDAERAAEREAELANTEPLPEGRYEIEGEIISTKWQESQYGSALKMLVKFADGNKVWGTVPESLWTTEHDEYGPRGSTPPAKGDHVVFKATVTRSDDDEHFGFFKRPTNARRAEDDLRLTERTTA